MLTPMKLNTRPKSAARELRAEHDAASRLSGAEAAICAT
jgi:hypothetical protein